MSEKDGGPAFPCHEPFDQFDDDLGKYETVYLPTGGMSLRDYFAAKAMHAELVTAGALEGPAIALAVAASQAGQTIPERVAFNAYLMADAMLIERAKGTTS